MDTGPLVALLAGDDSHHAWAVEQSKSAPSTVLTCEAVISEASFLLKRARYRVDDLFALIDVGFVRIDFALQSEASSVRKLMHKYRERPMSFADACMVRMAERVPEGIIWTVDSDFRFYRKDGKQTLSLIAPD